MGLMVACGLKFEYLTCLETTLSTTEFAPNSSAAEQLFIQLKYQDLDPCNESIITSYLQLPPVQEFIHRFNLQFLDWSLFVNSMVHSSFAHECCSLELDNNEKLEFLGDSVLGLCVTKIIYQRHDSLAEGNLSKMRGAIVNETELAKLALFMNLPQLILLGKGEIRTGGNLRASVQADAFEAFIGALFLNGGFDRTFDFLENFFHQYQKASGTDLFSVEVLKRFDAKSMLQELTMALYRELPVYEGVEAEVEGQSGFEVRVLLMGKEIGRKFHPSKKKAQRLLAREIIDNELYLNIGGEDATQGSASTQ